MLSLKNGRTLAALLIGAFPLFMYVLILPHLPQSVPVHFGFSGTPDRWAAPMSVETVMLASLGIMGFILMKVMQYIVIMPLRGTAHGMEATHKLFDFLVLAVTALFTAFGLYTQYMMQTEGYAFDLAFYIGAPCVIAGMLFIGGGHLMRGDGTHGTQRVTRRTFYVCGLFIMLFALIPFMWAYILIGAALIAMAAVPGVYALAHRKRVEK